jgi:putative endonuclease
MALAQFIAKLLCPWRAGSSTSSPEHLLLGRSGERAAAAYLRRRGFKILYRNFRPPRGGEIDLVCREKRTLVFVEVKTRTPGGPGRPADAVDSAKEDAIILGAHAWLRMLDEKEIPVRIDIVEVLLGEGTKPLITHTRDALAFISTASR